MLSSFEFKLVTWCCSGTSSRIEKLFIGLKYVMRDDKRSEEKLQEEQRLQIHAALFPYGSPWGNEMFKQATWHQESHALQQIIRSSKQAFFLRREQLCQTEQGPGWG